MAPAQAGSQGAIVDLLGRLVDTTNPAMAGSVVVIFCSGLGSVINTPVTGSPASGAAISTTLSTPTVTIEGIQAPVLFSGLTPGAVGEYQVNVHVPVGLGIGSNVPVVLTIGGVSSNTAIISVR
jgi:uncharacterized protein (TIGR03437 family)